MPIKNGGEGDRGRREEERRRKSPSGAKPEGLQG
jgi:hypothetical protein